MLVSSICFLFLFFASLSIRICSFLRCTCVRKMHRVPRPYACISTEYMVYKILFYPVHALSRLLLHSEYSRSLSLYLPLSPVLLLFISLIFVFVFQIYFGFGLVFPRFLYIFACLLLWYTLSVVVSLLWRSNFVIALYCVVAIRCSHCRFNLFFLLHWIRLLQASFCALCQYTNNDRAC